jgi:sugar lactone lactonase YvrE
MWKKAGLGLLTLVLSAAAYLAVWPVPIQAESWQAPAVPGYQGPHALNNKLAGLTLIALGGESGPEHVALGPDGKLYAAVASGRILRMNADGTGQETFATTGGRVLGFDFDAAGNLIAADAIKGLLSVSPKGDVSVLVDKVSGSPLLFTDAVVVAKSGKVYFSDASMRFGPAKWGSTYEAAILDIIEQASTGRILEYDPASKTTRVVAQGLAFANGVALSGDEQTLFVAETGKYRIWTVAVAAQALDVRQASPQARVLIDNIPGYPDNLMRGQEGRIWVGLSGPRSAQVDQMAGKPFLREVTLRLPRALWPLPKPYGHVFAFNEAGQVVADLQDSSGAYPQTTGATETADRIYVQNLHSPVLGWKAR